MKPFLSFLGGLITFLLIIWGAWEIIDFVTSTFKSDVAGDIFKILCFFLMEIPVVWVAVLAGVFIYAIIKSLFK